MDEDGRDGPGGAAGETEDSHPNHRWVRPIYMYNPFTLFLYVTSEDLAG